MIKIIAIILLAISTAGAGYFGWTQKKLGAAATEQVAEPVSYTHLTLPTNREV